MTGHSLTAAGAAGSAMFSVISFSTSACAASAKLTATRASGAMIRMRQPTTTMTAAITGLFPISRESASNIGNSATVRIADQMTISANGAMSTMVQ